MSGGIVICFTLCIALLPEDAQINSAMTDKSGQKKSPPEGLKMRHNSNSSTICKMYSKLSILPSI